jgi:CubicO group peptidase (beta-lactamase class C family)
MRTLISTIALFLVFSLFGQTVPTQKLDSIVSSKVKEDHPGIAVGIVHNGKIVYEKYRGLSNLQHQIPFDEKTRSNIASTAKQFTALMILQLSFEHKIHLEDDIRKYLPNLYKNVKEEIKIRNLLNHTSGIRDYVELLDLEGAVWWQRFGYDNDDVLALLEKQEDLGFAPRSRKYYSNSNYNVLAEIIEKVTGKSFNEYSKKFFEELGMKETSFVERYMKVIPNRANPYSDWGRGEWWEVPTVTKTNGEGFLFTTLKDQLIFEKAIQNARHNNDVLLIESQKPIPNSTITTYGFGLELTDKLNRKSVHHSGGTYGFHSQTYRFPEEKLSIFIMSNNGNISSNLIAQEMGKLLLPEIKKEDQYNSRLHENTLADTPQILGQYRSPSGFLTRIVEEEGKTYFRQKKSLRIELIPETKNLYHLSYNPKEKVVFYQNEMVLFDPSGETSVFDRVTDKSASLSDLEGFVGTYHNRELEIGFDLTLTNDSQLKLTFSNGDRTIEVEVFNRNELLAGENYVIKAQRDAFDRITEVRLDYGRAMNIGFQKKSNLRFQPKIETEGGSIQVTTIGSRHTDGSQILLTKNKPNGNEIWYKTFGGNSYDKASSILETQDGYLIIGSTSSYGVGNYDMFVIKTDKKGKKLWQNTYGKFDNDYGYTAEKVDNGFIIKGTTQLCNSRDVLNRECSIRVWFVTIDENGKELSNKVLEEINP